MKQEILIIMLIMFLIGYTIEIIVNEVEPRIDLLMQAEFPFPMGDESYWLIDFMIEDTSETLSGQQALFQFALSETSGAMVLGQNAIYGYVKLQTDNTIDIDVHTYYGGSSGSFSQVEINKYERYTMLFRFIDGSPGQIYFYVFDAAGVKIVNFSRSVDNWGGENFYKYLNVPKRADLTAKMNFWNFRDLFVDRTGFIDPNFAIDYPFNKLPFQYGGTDPQYVTYRTYELNTSGWTQL